MCAHPGNGSWVAYFDLLGTKESSRKSGKSLGRLLREFQSKVVDRSSMLGPESGLYHFSDCVILEIPTTSAEIRGFFDWLSEVQIALYEGGDFFKCAVVTGTLNPHVQKPGRSKRTSTSFLGDSAVRAYELHESFKGIGVYFDDEVVRTLPKIHESDFPSEAQERMQMYFNDGIFNPFVPSFYVSMSRDGTEVAIPYMDMRILPSVLVSRQGQGNLEFEHGENGAFEAEAIRQIMRQFIKANLKSERYGRYYMSLLCSAVSSSDYSGLALTADGKWFENLPIVSAKLLEEPHRLKEIEKVPGFAFLLFRLMDCILSSSSLNDDTDNELKDKPNVVLARKLKEYRWILRHIQSVPSTIISPDNKDKVLDAFGDVVIKG
jgi:hypothetical protein